MQTIMAYTVTLTPRADIRSGRGFPALEEMKLPQCPRENGFGAAEDTRGSEARIKLVTRRASCVGVEQTMKYESWRAFAFY